MDNFNMLLISLYESLLEKVGRLLVITLNNGEKNTNNGKKKFKRFKKSAFFTKCINLLNLLNF
ncbi:hypothetical protein EGI32_12915 [Ferruginibacter sp. HRS2-29]|nr:hypothetical protein [Ferruginibacter sp. HRS2-29]